MGPPGREGYEIRWDPAIYDDPEDDLRTHLEWLRNNIGIDLRKDKTTYAFFSHACNGRSLCGPS